MSDYIGQPSDANILLKFQDLVVGCEAITHIMQAWIGKDESVRFRQSIWPLPILLF